MSPIRIATSLKMFVAIHSRTFAKTSTCRHAPLKSATTGRHTATR
jgi:hypothetical protein